MFIKLFLNIFKHSKKNTFKGQAVNKSNKFFKRIDQSNLKKEKKNLSKTCKIKIKPIYSLK